MLILDPDPTNSFGPDRIWTHSTALDPTCWIRILAKTRLRNANFQSQVYIEIIYKLGTVPLLNLASSR